MCLAPWRVVKAATQAWAKTKPNARSMVRSVLLVHCMFRHCLVSLGFGLTVPLQGYFVLSAFLVPLLRQVFLSTNIMFFSKINYPTVICSSLVFPIDFSRHQSITNTLLILLEI